MNKDLARFARSMSRATGTLRYKASAVAELPIRAQAG